MKLQVYRKSKNTVMAGCVILLCLCVFSIKVEAQQVSPFQTGEYLPAFIDVRDMAQPPPGLFLLLYDYYGFSNKYFDRNGDHNRTLPAGLLDPSLETIDLDFSLNGFVTIPAIYWASSKTFLGGARFMGGITPIYMWMDASVTARVETISGDTSMTENSKLSGFGDFAFSPAGLYWGFSKWDISLVYNITAPTGRYETGGDDNIGLGFWTNMPQIFAYYYPVKDKSTALMGGLSYEFTGKLKGEDFNPGNRLTLEWGISQYVSEKVELAVQGGNNWQVTDDIGDDVNWDATLHDRKSTVGFMIGYAPVEQFDIMFKYTLDFGLRQRFKTNAFMLNFIYVPNILAGKKKQSK